MKVTPFVINFVAKQLMGGVPFESMKRIVSVLNNSAMSGEGKRKTALHEFATLGYVLAGWMINLGLELAVAYLKSQSTK